MDVYPACDPKLSIEKERALTDMFVAMMLRDLGEPFSLWLRRFSFGPAKLLELQDIFATIGKRGRVGNMPLENLLALLKMASKTGRSGHPHSERM